VHTETPFSQSFSGWDGFFAKAAKMGCLNGCHVSAFWGETPLPSGTYLGKAIALPKNFI